MKNKTLEEFFYGCIGLLVVVLFLVFILFLIWLLWIFAMPAMFPNLNESFTQPDFFVFCAFWVLLRLIRGGWKSKAKAEK